MRLQKQTQRGFTLIELMITVAIVGILAAFALPAYQDYVIKSQVSEGLLLSDGAKTYMSEFYAQNGSFDIPVGAFAPATGKYVSSVQVNKPGGGNILVIYGNNVNQKIMGGNIVLTSVPQAECILQWSCNSQSMSGVTNSSPIDNKYLPSVCQGTNH